MKSALVTIIEKAEIKFGTVEKVENKDGQTFLLTIKRKNPTMPNYPYMTINGRIFGISEEGFSVDFFHGHYDLTKEATI